MREQLTKRLDELRKDFEAGQARLGQLDREAGQLRETLLRIAGAIQVLEETLSQSATADGKALAAE